jgi:UNC-50 family
MIRSPCLTRTHTHTHTHSVEQEVEWRYAFDIHTNAFLPFFLVSSVLQYILLPILMGEDPPPHPCT